MNTERAKQLGEQAGEAGAARWKVDPECFEDTPNPFGIDSEPEFHDAWAAGYENEFELNK